VTERGRNDGPDPSGTEWHDRAREQQQVLYDSFGQSRETLGENLLLGACAAALAELSSRKKNTRMRITTDLVCHDGHLGYLAWPDCAPTPLSGVVLIQEIWGADAHIQDVAVRLASTGCATFAPDLYATNGRRPESMTVERIAEVQGFMNSLPRTTWMNPAERDAELAKLTVTGCPTRETGRMSRTRVQKSRPTVDGRCMRSGVFCRAACADWIFATALSLACALVGCGGTGCRGARSAGHRRFISAHAGNG